MSVIQFINVAINLLIFNLINYKSLDSQGQYNLLMDQEDNHTNFSFCVDDREQHQLSVKINDCTQYKIEIGMEKQKLPPFHYSCKMTHLHRMLKSDLISDKQCCNCKIRIPHRKYNIWEDKHTIKSLFVKGFFTTVKSHEIYISRINLKELVSDGEDEQYGDDAVNILQDYQSDIGSDDIVVSDDGDGEQEDQVGNHGIVDL